MAAAKSWSISAEWIVPVDGEPIRRGVLRGRGGVIEAIGPARKVHPAAKHRALGEVAVLPGLINAHTHLELSHLRRKLPPKRPMTQWLFGVFRGQVVGADHSRSVVAGADEALALGTTTIADVCHNNGAWRELKDHSLRALCLAEVAGIGPLAHGAMRRLRKSLRGTRRTTCLRFGISLHAPYSTAEEVYREAIALARKRRMIVATHLAETEGERQFLLRGSGKFFDFLAQMGMIDSSVRVHGVKPMEFARRVGLLDGPAILAHVNYIDNEEMRILADGKASVAYCPRCCDYFGHSGHRYAEMIQAGVNVALGTDSLASNDSLSMLDEMRRLRSDGKVDRDTILRMATINGAKAMGWDETIGSLSPGKSADWIVVDLPRETHHPLEAILTSDGRVTEVGIAGKVVHAVVGK